MEIPERKLGPYTLVSKIGRGAFGIVWLAEKRSAIATTRFALKLPRDEDIDLEAFKQEAAIWLQASGHPNVVPMIEADIYDEQIVIVSEYVTDGSLASWIKQHGGRAPSIEAASELIEGVLSGLAHLHSRQIIHRDLKPDNILLQHETPRLADFGIARLLKSGSYSMNISGTLAYMAPEAFDGKRTEQTDVWSAGVIYYQLLSGRLPYDQTEMASFVGSIMRSDPPPLPESVPEVLQSIVMKALRREPSERYASAKDMRQDLRVAEHKLWQVNQHEPVSEPVVPSSERASQPTIPYPQPAVTQKLDSVEVSIPIPPVNPPVVEISKNPRNPLWVFGVVAVLVLGNILAIGIYFWVTSRGSSQGPDGSSKAANPKPPDLSQKRYALKQTLTGHTDVVRYVAFAPDGKTLASVGYDDTIKLWDPVTGALKQTLTGHKSDINSVAFSPDGKTLATSDADKLIKLWDLQTGIVKQTLLGHNGMVWSVDFSPDGKTLASGAGDNNVILWDVQSGTVKQTLSGSTGTVRYVGFSPDGKTLASTGDDDLVRLWDTKTGLAKRNLSGHTAIVRNASFSPDGTTIASASDDNTVKLWETETGTLKRTISSSNDVNLVVFSPDGKTLAGALGGSVVNLWDVESGTLKQSLTGHTSLVWSVAFSPDGRILASASIDKTVKLWQVE